MGCWWTRQKCKQFIMSCLHWTVYPCILVVHLYSQRPLWRHYFQNTDVLIFVVDSNDRERMDECKDEIGRFICEDELRDCCLLIMANKQDLPNAMSLEEITEKLELNKLPPTRTWSKCFHLVYMHLSLYTYYSQTFKVHVPLMEMACMKVWIGWRTHWLPNMWRRVSLSLRLK